MCIRDRLAKLLVNYSCDIQKDEKILIDYEGAECKPLIKQIIRDAVSYTHLFCLLL